MKAKRILYLIGLIIFLATPHTGKSQTGSTHDSIPESSTASTSADSVYHFTEDQVKEILKALDELDECESVVLKCKEIAVDADHKMQLLSEDLRKANKKTKRAKNWRNIFIGTTAILGTVIIITR